MTTKLENFSTLGARLREIEVEHVEVDDGGALDARRAVVETLEKYHTSRYRFGEALATYRAHFMEERGWMEVAQAIGAAMGRDERTVRNILADYQRAATLPETVIAAAEAEGIDLAERKHARLLASMEGKLAVNDVPTLPEAQQILGKVLEMRAPGAPKAKLDRAEKIRWAIRIKIRTALTNVPNDRKLTELIAALEEEMYEVMGETEPITVTITPRQSSLTIDGRKRVTA
ncbi:MAG: hypothetical protein WCE63_03485 [Acidobacteriaceae bacterium]